MKRELRYKGSFYPENIDDITNFIKKNEKKVIEIEGLKGLILPHAGWIYSGSTALKGMSHKPKECVKNIYLIGPSHYLSFDGVALSRYNFYEAISEDFKLNKEIESELLQIPGVKVLDDAHIHEHSLEVELEFIKHYYPKASLIPIIAGSYSTGALVQILKRSLNEPNSLTIISSDLSHYKPYKDAVKMDKISIDTISSSQNKLNYNNACGLYAINALIALNKDKDFDIKLIYYNNSGDSGGDKKSVVGYCAMEIISRG